MKRMSCLLPRDQQVRVWRYLSFHIQWIPWWRRLRPFMHFQSHQRRRLFFHILRFKLELWNCKMESFIDLFRSRIVHSSRQCGHVIHIIFKRHLNFHHECQRQRGASPAGGRLEWDIKWNIASPPRCGAFLLPRCVKPVKKLLTTYFFIWAQARGTEWGDDNFLYSFLPVEYCCGNIFIQRNCWKAK